LVPPLCFSLSGDLVSELYERALVIPRRILSVLAVLSVMHLYNFTIQKPTAVVTAIAGNFSSTKQQEIVIARGKTLELQRPNDAGKLVSLLQWECFGIIRSIAPFRLPGLLFIPLLLFLIGRLLVDG
jgi:hypothetical protein